MLERLFPIDQPHGLVVFAHIGLDLNAIAQQTIDGLIDIIEAARLVYRHFLNS